MKKVLILDPVKEVRKFLPIDEFSKLRVETNGQIYYKQRKDFFKKYSIIICFNAVNEYNLYIILKCRLMGIRTAFFSDGIFELSNALYNKKHKKHKLYFPLVTADFLVLTCAYGRDFLENSNPYITVLEYLPWRINKGIPDVEPNINRSNSILLTTARTPFFNREEFEKIIELYRDIIDIAKSMQLTIKWRIPNEDIAKALPLEEENALNGGTFSDVCKQVDIVITTPSSIVIEAMIHGKPTAIADYRDIPLLCYAGWKIHQGINIRETINSMLNNDKTRMEIQGNLIKSVKKYQVSDYEQLLLNLSVKSFYYEKRLVKEYKTIEQSILNSPVNFNLYIFIKKILKFFKIRQ